MQVCDRCKEPKDKLIKGFDIELCSDCLKQVMTEIKSYRKSFLDKMLSGVNSVASKV